MQLLWYTEATTELVVPRPDKRERWRTPHAVVEAIARLTTGRTDAAIATALNELGLRSGRDKPFTADAVAWIRFKYGI